VALIPRLTEEFFDHPTGSLGTLRCAPYHVGGRALLIGDAAHPIVPFFGQGMNTGFEDCRVLDDLLDAHGDEAWDRVFAEFTRLRKPNADAIADMALENFVEMRDRVGDARFVLRKSVEHRLEQNMPKVYRSRYSMVMYSHIPFRLAYEAGRLQHELLDEFCDGLGRAEDLDLAAARRAIDERLTPFLEGHGISLDY
jgi:kynurenine 3-monooxygenase